MGLGKIGLDFYGALASGNGLRVSPQPAQRDAQVAMEKGYLSVDRDRAANVLHRVLVAPRLIFD
jgi:hypothetical protein